MNYEYARFVLFTFRDDLFPHIRTIFFLPLCVRHGKTDTDRFFRVLRLFIDLWLLDHTFLFPKQLHEAILQQIKINRRQRRLNSKTF